MLAPKQRNVKPRNYTNASKSSPCKRSIFCRNDIVLLHQRVGSSWCAECLRSYCGWIKPPSFLLFLLLGTTVHLLLWARELTSSEGTPAPLINWWGSCQRVLLASPAAPSTLPVLWPRAAPQPCASLCKILLLTKPMVSHRHSPLITRTVRDRWQKEGIICLIYPCWYKSVPWSFWPHYCS